MSLDATEFDRQIARLEQEVEDRLMQAGMKPNLVRSQEARKLAGEIAEKLSKYAKNLGNFTRNASGDADLHRYELYQLLRKVASQVEVINPADPSASDALQGILTDVTRFGEQPQTQM
jgi:hypothetical protein